MMRIIVMTTMQAVIPDTNDDKSPYHCLMSRLPSQLKRRHVQLMTKRMRNSETPAGLLLLTLLSQCCQVCLKENSVNSLAEVSLVWCVCVFFFSFSFGGVLCIVLVMCFFWIDIYIFCVVVFLFRNCSIA